MRHLPILFLLVSAATSGAEPVEPVLADLAAYQHPDYIGGLDARAIALSVRLAQSFGALLPGESTPCGAADPLRGQMIRGPALEHQRATLPEQIPASLRPLAVAIRDGSEVQKSIGYRAIGLIGTKARDAAPLLGERAPNGPWAAEALHRLTCIARSMGGLESLVPPGKLPRTKDWRCGAERAEWLLVHVAAAGREWPGEWILDAWHEISAGCKRAAVDIPLSASALGKLAARIRADDGDPAVRSAWLSVAADLGPRAAFLEDELKLLTSDPDRDTAWAAQRALVATGTASGARQFARWLSVDHLFNWRWGETKLLKPHADIVLLALGQALSDPVFGNRAAAARVLGELETPSAIPLLAGAVKSSDWPTAQAVVNALAPLAKEHPEAAGALRHIAESYWSGRVRLVARMAMEKGHGVRGDPFSCDAADVPPSAEGMEAGQEQLCMHMGYASAMEHELARCKSDDRGVYRDASGEQHRISWSDPRRQDLPRVKFVELSDWCEPHGTAEVLPVADGWLVGCDGFEREGALGFVPRKGKATVTPIVRMGVTALLELHGRYFVAGSSPIEFGDAGALYEIRRDASNAWSTTAIAALPSIPWKHAIVGSKLAFFDQESAVTFDVDAGALQPLVCAE